VKEPFSISALEEALGVDGAQEIIESFLEDSSGLLNMIEEAILTRDKEFLRSNCHKLSGCYRAIGANDGYQLSSALETYATQQNWSAVASLLSEFKDSYELIAVSAKRYLNGA
jgi:HPt (histidine-containing phosphotransfer) domain-containing protein